MCADYVPCGAVVVCGYAFAKRIGALVIWYGSGGSSRRAREPLAIVTCLDPPIPAAGFGRDATGLDSHVRAWRSRRSSTTGRACHYDCMTRGDRPLGAVIAFCDAFAKRSSVTSWCDSGGSSGWACGTSG